MAQQSKVEDAWVLVRAMVGYGRVRPWHAALSPHQMDFGGFSRCRRLYNLKIHICFLKKNTLVLPSSLPAVPPPRRRYGRVAGGQRPRRGHEGARRCVAWGGERPGLDWGRGRGKEERQLCVESGRRHGSPLYIYQWKNELTPSKIETNTKPNQDSTNRNQGKKTKSSLNPYLD